MGKMDILKYHLKKMDSDIRGNGKVDINVPLDHLKNLTSQLENQTID